MEPAENFSASTFAFCQRQIDDDSFVKCSENTRKVFSVLSMHVLKPVVVFIHASSMTSGKVGLSVAWLTGSD